ncbi:MAG: serine aminopeptidase domain-containing protein, partial [Acidimicrobiales bacterium]
MRTLPLWFGPAERRLFGWMHQPEGGRARGAVVLCPPFGLEGVNAHHTYRRLATQLAAEGLAVLRFDYDGTGDSVGHHGDPNRPEAWLASIRSAVELVRCAGATQVAMVGMRMGATLAAAAAARWPLDALVLWDACPSGRSFVRQQKAMWGVLVDQAPEGVALGAGSAVETPGLPWEAGDPPDLSDLDLARLDGPLAARLLVLSRPGRPPGAWLAPTLASASLCPEEVAGQPELLDCPSLLAAVPEAAVATVSAWLSRTLDAAPAAFSVSPGGSAVVGRDPLGRRIVERPLRLGPNGLFAMATELERGGAESTVLLVNTGLEHHIGPMRLWVDLARGWAASGVRTVRFDVSGVGDSPVRPGQAEHVVHAPEWLDDAADAVAAVSGGDPSEVMVVGHCAGGYL